MPEVRRCHAQRTVLPIVQLVILVILFSVFALTTQAQTSVTEIPPAAAFLNYTCEFQSTTNTAVIRGFLVGADGQPIARENFRPTVSVVETGEILPTERITITTIPQRNPIQMILVLDITETVPITEIVRAVTEELAPRLLPDDQVALITFSAEIAPRTQFYTDKNRLINEHMLDMQPLEGDNQLYDAVLEAVSGLPLSGGVRQSVLILTDSNRRDTKQVALSEIIAPAQRENIQIYAIGFFTRDRPDANELRTLASATGGYAWIYDEIRNTRASIEIAVKEFLQEFVTTLNSEVTFTVDLQGQQPNANGRITFKLDIDTDNDAVLTDEISCPIQALNHDIRFITQPSGTTLSGQLDAVVQIESDLAVSTLRVVFWVNNERVQDSASTVYTFNAATRPPGYYTIGAQLVDSDGNLLASTPTTLEIYAQQVLDLRVLTQDNNVPDLTQLNGGVQLIATTGNLEAGLRAAEFTIAPLSNLENVRLLSDSTIGFGANGSAILTINDISRKINELFPDAAETERYQLRVSVPPVVAQDPPQAVSNVLEIRTLPPPPPTPTPQPTPLLPPIIEVPTVVQRVIAFPPTIPLVLILFLLLVNILLYRAVRRGVIRQHIRYEDNHELSPQLMAITVWRDGIKQTYPLTKKTVDIGRGASNFINLGDSQNISRRHGIVMWRDQAWYYSNAKPRITVRINGKRYRGLIYYKLEPVTQIEIGALRLIFHSNAQQDISEFVKTNLR